MKLLFTFEQLHQKWSVQQMFNRYFEWFKETYSNIECVHINTQYLDKSNPSGLYSPHLMTIRNDDTKKYFLVSYWDKAIELTYTGNGWDYENCVGIVTSSGVHYDLTNIIPFSYMTYSLDFEKESNETIIPFENKKNTDLNFRGFLYEMRYELNKIAPNQITNNKLPVNEYVKELNENKICLSLNGAGEICNRDMEILSVGSVLLRPLLKQKFFDPLIPNYHYIPFDISEDPKIQWEIILEKFNEIKNDNEKLKYIAYNGLNWYKNNGTINSNVDILKKIINIEKLK